MVRIHGVPFDLCGRVPGSRLGPIAVRFAGLLPQLRALGLAVEDAGSVSPLDEQVETPLVERYTKARLVYAALKERVRADIEAGCTPLVVGGDHSVSIGSIAGALAATQGDLAVLWIDAHMDVNLPTTSPSGNLHGMSLAALAKMPIPEGDPMARDWAEILALVGDQALAPGHVCWFGIREVDGGELRQRAQMERSLMVTMQRIDQHGVASCVERVDRWLRELRVSHLWVSFDVDSLDPIYAPGTGTAVRGGLTYREGHLLAEMLHEMLQAKDCPYRLCGADLVEVNPLADTNNETARVACGWAASLFGKTILGLAKRT